MTPSAALRNVSALFRFCSRSAVGVALARTPDSRRRAWPSRALRLLLSPPATCYDHPLAALGSSLIHGRLPRLHQTREKTMGPATCAVEPAPGVAKSQSTSNEEESRRTSEAHHRIQLTTAHGSTSALPLVYHPSRAAGGWLADRQLRRVGHPAPLHPFTKASIFRSPLLPAADAPCCPASHDAAALAVAPPLVRVLEVGELALVDGSPPLRADGLHGRGE